MLVCPLSLNVFLDYIHRNGTSRCNKIRRRPQRCIAIKVFFYNAVILWSGMNLLRKLCLQAADHIRQIFRWWQGNQQMDVVFICFSGNKFSAVSYAKLSCFGYHKITDLIGDYRFSPGARFFLREYIKRGVTGLPATPQRTLSTLHELVCNGLSLTEPTGKPVGFCWRDSSTCVHRIVAHRLWQAHLLRSSRYGHAARRPQLSSKMRTVCILKIQFILYPEGHTVRCPFLFSLLCNSDPGIHNLSSGTYYFSNHHLFFL